MKTGQLIVRSVGTAVLVLGLLLWGDAFPILTPIHMLLGIVLVVTLLVMVALGLRSRVGGGLLVVGVVVAVATPLLGLNQQMLLVGDLHILVQLAHLLVGLAAIGVAEAIAARAMAGTGDA